MLARALAGLGAAFACALGVAAPFPEPLDLGHGVHVFLGAAEEASRGNGGHIANQGFIVAATGVIVIDTGLSARFAGHMLHAIRARTAKPLALVILTWPMDEAIFGAALFQQQGAPVLAHEEAAALIAARCRLCLEQRTTTLGAELMAGTQVPRPDQRFRGSRLLVVAGRRLQLIDESGAAAPGSIAVWDSESGVLFAGGMASFGTIPETRNGALNKWIRALERLATLPARAVVPAHGPVGSVVELDNFTTYLLALQARTRQAYAAGVSLLHAPRSVVVEDYRTWALYEVIHPRNVHHLYLELERRELLGELP